MFNKTSSILCSDYSETLPSFPFLGPDVPKAKRIKLKRKTITEMHVSESPVYLQTYEGIIGILFTKDIQQTPLLFVIHKTVKIRPGIYYNVVSLSDSSVLTTQSGNDTLTQTVLIKPYEVDMIRSDFEVDEIYAFYYSTKGHNYRFEGEKHPYWELTFVDNGELICMVNSQVYPMPTRSLMFFGPDQFHSQETAADKTCSFMTIMFSTKNFVPERITNRVITCSQDMYTILSFFLHHSNEPWQLRNDMLLSLLKCLLVNAVNSDSETNVAINPMQQHYENELLNEILEYINNNFQNLLTINDICRKFAISRSSLQTLFKKHLDLPPKFYINNAKLEYSKILLKKSSHTVSQISDMLGFSSIHYFSRKFKLVYGITPSEYAKSIAI